MHNLVVNTTFNVKSTYDNVAFKSVCITNLNAGWMFTSELMQVMHKLNCCSKPNICCDQ